MTECILVGDRVRVREGADDRASGSTGTVTHVAGRTNQDIYVKLDVPVQLWPNFSTDELWFIASELELS